jgi:hypothetical protein
MTPADLARAIRRLPAPCPHHPWRFDEDRSTLAAAVMTLGEPCAGCPVPRLRALLAGARGALAGQRAELGQMRRLLAQAAQRRPRRRHGHDPRQLRLLIPD